MDAGASRPTAEKVIARLKDDGDFDSLRLKIIRKVKENGELRNNIIAEVKQSMVLNEDGSEKLKLRQLSDAIYQEIGSKIMGEISEEVWKAIRSSENDIKGTVEAVYNRIVNPNMKKEERSSPSKQQLANGKDDHAASTLSKSEMSVTDDNEPLEPPGFSQSNQSSKSKVGENTEMIRDGHPHSSSDDLKQPQEQDDDEAPPGFGQPSNGALVSSGVSDEDLEAPPGFG